MISNLPLTSPVLVAEYRAKGFWHDVNLADRFFGVATAVGEKTALIVGDNCISYSQLVQDIRALAANLIALGLQPGDVVAGQMPNRAEIPMLHLACNTVGLLYMPLHDSWREGELTHLLKLAKVKVVVSMGWYRGFDHATMFTSIGAELPDLRHIFSLDGADKGVQPFSLLLQVHPDGESLIEGRRPDPDLPAALMLSGGTTAISKISRFSSNNLIAMLEAAAAAVKFSRSDIAGAIAPAGTGATGYIYPILMPLLWGATSVILPRWGDPADALELLERHQCTYAVAIPAQLSKMLPLLDGSSVGKYTALRCFTNAGAPLSPDTGSKIELYLSCHIQSIYGATDGGTPTMTNIDDPDEKRLHSVGRPVAYADVKICGADGEPLASGEAGEIVWRGADKSWGYLGDEDQTAATFTSDGYYKSGDIGVIDDQNYLRVTGRIKDMILRGGRNISPSSIEGPLMNHQAVLDVAVAAMPDPVLGERACAFVILKPSTSLSFQEMIGFLKQQDLAVWQLPERLILLEDFPRGAGGKVRKAELTQIAIRTPMS